MRATVFTTIAAFAAAAFAAPCPQAAAAGDAAAAATVGYATQNGGTTGGAGGAVTRVSTIDALVAAAEGEAPAIIIVDGTINSKTRVNVGSNKSILGAGASAELIGVSLTVNNQKNVIIRNLKISKVEASTGDAIGISRTSNVWVDHMDLSSDLTSGKDFYDGLLDITRHADFVTVSNCKLHDHFKTSLIGSSDNTGDEDRGHLKVTYYNNYWFNTNSRSPSLRFGTIHVFNNVYENVADGINVRQGAQALIENNVWSGKVSKTIYTVDQGGAVNRGNDFGGVEPTLTTGTLTEMPYKYTLRSLADMTADVKANSGNTLTISG